MSDGFSKKMLEIMDKYKAEIERLKADKAKCEADCMPAELMLEIKAKDAEIERLKKTISIIGHAYQPKFKQENEK